ncbi:MAG: DUF1934 domain-containing protein [Oscillospiraceae bacterium]
MMKEKMQKVFIKVEISQRPIDILGKVAKEPECSEILTYGEFYKKAGVYILEYDELDDYKNYYCTTRIELKEEAGKYKVTVIKEGKISTILPIEVGKSADCLYNTPYGSLDIGIWGEVVQASICEDGGTIEFKYQLDVNSMATSKNHIKITISKYIEGEKK